MTITLMNMQTLMYLEVNLRCILDNPLHVHLDELVEGVELLPNQA